MSNNPWEDPNSVWKTEAQYFTWLRGSLRKLWSDYPLRQEWKKKSLRPVTQQERESKKFHPSTKNVGQCVFCKEWFPGSKLQVDHMESSDGCHNYETAEKFLWYCGGLTSDHFQLSCVPCHKIETYREKQGISFEEARATKEAIAIQKQKQDVSWLKTAGIDPAKNAKERRQQIIDYLMSKQ